MKVYRSWEKEGARPCPRVEYQSADLRRKTAIAFKREKFPDDVCESKRRSEIVPFFHSRVLICGYTVLFRVTRKFINFFTLEKMWPTLPCLRFPKFANIFYRKFTIITSKRVIKKRRKRRRRKKNSKLVLFRRERKRESQNLNTKHEKLRRCERICVKILMRAKVWKKKCPSGNTI